ncbi:MAG: hypothetical protein H6733_09475 [Alphaproteobacteria bacterium]|nr:hypothetical protein [Alphaproteobacteria bacterium]
MSRLLVLSALLVTALGCDPLEVGEACQATGSGFTRQDPCAEMCVDWAITCPDGGTVTPDLCSGALCGTTGVCPAGQSCVQIDSFATNSRCLPDVVCGP